MWRLFASGTGDDLACALARLLVWEDPAPLPVDVASAAQVAYTYYDWNWRPGRKRPQYWPAALEVVATRSPALPPAPMPDLEARVKRLEGEVSTLKATLVR